MDTESLRENDDTWGQTAFANWNRQKLGLATWQPNGTTLLIIGKLQI